MIDSGTALRLAGMRLAGRALTGPEVVQIDLTDTCRNNCVGCWARSPFLRDGDHYDTLRKGELDFGFVSSLIGQLAPLGVTEIFLGGGGDPTCHPRLADVVSRVKECGMRCVLNTSLVCADERLLDALCDAGLDTLIASVWAGNPRTYARLHPNKGEMAFANVTTLLKRIADRRASGRAAPRVKVYQVVCALNYRELPELIGYGRDVDADEVELSIFDPIPGRTSMFNLGESHIRHIDRFFESFKDEGRPFVHRELFLRRLHNIDILKGVFDNGIVASIPCAAGWFHARVTTVGLLNGCLKAHRIPTGDLNSSSFEQLWFGETHNEFRRQTIRVRHDNPYLENIGHDLKFGLPGCFRICDNLGHNQGVMRMEGGLSAEDRVLVERLAAMAKSGASRDEILRVSRGEPELRNADQGLGRLQAQSPQPNAQSLKPQALTIAADIDLLHDHIAGASPGFARTLQSLVKLTPNETIRVPLLPENIFRLPEIIRLIAEKTGRKIDAASALEFSPLPLSDLPKRLGPFLAGAKTALAPSGVLLDPAEASLRALFEAAADSGEDDDERLRALGVIANRALTGPRTFHLDVTNACNSDCVQCWFHSPLAKDRVDAADFGPAWKKQMLDFDDFTRLADDLAAMNAGRDVVLSGKGEPSVHPRIADMVRYLKEKGLFTTLFTNGIGLSTALRESCVRAGCDMLYVSLSAATEKEYALLHSNVAAGEFRRYLENISELVKLKKGRKSGLPRIVLVDVICNRNAASVVEFARLAAGLGVDLLRYQLTAIEPYNTTLALSEEQYGRVNSDMAAAKEITAAAGIGVIENIDEQLMGGGQDWSGARYLSDGCLAGWAFSRVWAGGEVSFCCSPKVVGSVREKSFREIWRSPEYDRARIAAKYIGRHRDFPFRNGRALYDPICSRCPNYEGIEHLRRTIDRLGLSAWL